MSSVPIPSEAPKPTRHFVGTLDGLRAVAVLLVLWAHLPMAELFRPAKFVNMALQPAYFGVDLFFVLSGFLITRILVYNRDKGIPLSHFLYRRAVRIFPIYYLTIALLLAVAYGPYLWWCACYLSNFRFAFDTLPNPMRHTWSLCVEEHFYLVWPALIYLLAPKRQPAAVFTVILIGALSALVIAALYPGNLAALLIYRVTPARMMSLGLGGMFAIFEFKLSDTTWRKRAALAFLLLGVLALGATLLISDPARTADVDAMAGWRTVARMYGFSLVSGFCFITVYGWNLGEGLLKNIMSKGAMPSIGKISYGLYLYHFPIFYYLGAMVGDEAMPGGTGHASAGKAVLALVVTFVFSTASYFLFERRLLDIKPAFIRNWKPSTP